MCCVVYDYILKKADFTYAREVMEEYKYAIEYNKWVWIVNEMNGFY